MTYSVITGDYQSTLIRRTNEDGSYLWIPQCPDNADYQEYLEWIAEGNTPEPAE